MQREVLTLRRVVAEERGALYPARTVTKEVTGLLSVDNSHLFIGRITTSES